MARIRSVKPELRTSRTVGEWPIDVRYAWVLLWGYLDDYGRGVDDLRTLKADLFPLDEQVTSKKLDSWLALMTQRTRWTQPERDAPLCRYEVGGITYLHAVYWRDHQRVSHPTRSSVPPCPIHDDDGSRREPVRGDSGAIPEPSQNGSRSGTEPEPNDAGVPPELFATSRTPAEQGSKGAREQGRGNARTARSTRIPEDLDLSGARARYAHDHGMSREIADREFAKFRAWHTSKGSKHENWDQTWLTWVLRWQDNTPKPQVVPHPDLPEGWA